MSKRSPSGLPVREVVKGEGGSPLEKSIFISSSEKFGSHDCSTQSLRVRGVELADGTSHPLPTLEEHYSQVCKGVQVRLGPGLVMDDSNWTAYVVFQFERSALPVYVVMRQSSEYWADGASMLDGINRSDESIYAIRVE